MKKIVGALILCTLSNAVWAEGTLTEQLRGKYSGKDIYAEYVWTAPKVNMSNAWGAQGQQVMIHSSKQRPVRPGSKEEANESRQEASVEPVNAEFPVKILAKHIYACFGKNIYMQHDYPKYISSDFPEMGVESYMNQAEYRKEEKRALFDKNLTGGILTSIFGCGQKENTDDLNIVYDGKVYFLDRQKKTGLWCALEDMERSRKAILYTYNNGMRSRNAIIDVVTASPDKFKVEFIDKTEKYIDGQKYLVETYSSQKLSVYGMPDGDARSFDLYYINGELVYFSGINEISEAISQQAAALHKQKQSKPIRPVLARLEKLEILADSSLFNVLPEYKLEQLPVK